MEWYIFFENVNITDNKYYLKNIHEREIGKMKQLKRTFVMLLCVGALCGLTACGSNGNTTDNGAVGNEATDNTGTTNGASDNTGNANGATDGTVNNNDNNVNNGNNGNGTVGDALENGVDDVGDAVGNGVNDVENGLNGNNTNNGTNR